MRYAILSDNVVTNVIVLNARASSAFPDAIPCGDKPVNIGDTYENGTFYRDGEEVLSDTEQLARMQEILDVLYEGIEPEVME